MRGLKKGLFGGGISPIHVGQGMTLDGLME